jgi:hypothetical protein
MILRGRGSQEMRSPTIGIEGGGCIRFCKKVCSINIHKEP